MEPEQSNRPIIEIEGYSWRYLHTEQPALDNIELTIEEGSFVGVIGPNRSGKTTLAYSLNGLIPTHYQGIKHGMVKVGGQEVEQYPAGELPRLVGVVFSDPEAQFTAMTVEDELVFGLENLGLSVPEIRERLEWVADLTLLGPLLEKPPYEISGGQKQRVALAAVLAMQPRVMVLDEPTSMLDPISRKRVFDVLARLKEEKHNTIIVIEHSLEHLVPLADRMVLLHDGRLLLHDETAHFFREVDLLDEAGVVAPGAIAFFQALLRRGLYHGEIPLSLEEAVRRMEEVVAARATGEMPA
jgi:energy-coupling factor transport system ATP-binding protein